MTPERWRQIEELYHSALERAPEQRSAFLDGASGGDADLRREVESLLQQSAGGVLDEPVWEEPGENGLNAGDELGPYRILGTLGVGGMGAVYKAHDKRLDRTVAIKISGTRFSGRFEREARAIASLNHPNICTVHDVGPNYLVMELVEGRPLRGPMPVKEMLRYAIEIAGALDAAHRRGVVHRDMKPDNILVTKSGVKVVDFGLAKIAATPTDATQTRLTGENAILGTLHYMSPEQVQGKNVGTPSDIFSFGAVLVEMLTGKRAFEGDNTAAVMSAIMTAEPAGLRGTDSTIPAPLKRLILCCLAKDPEDRWQSANDLRRELAWIAETLESPSAEIAAPASRSNLPWKIAGALFVATAAITIVLLGLPNQHTASPVMRLSVDLGDDAAIAPRRGSALDLSPDGTRLVYVIGQQIIKSRLAMRRLDETHATPMAGTDGAEAPFFSPDGKWVGFFAQGKLKKIEAGGGAPVTLCDAPSPRGGSWGDDDNIVFAPTNHGGLSRVASSGGTPQPVTEFDAKSGEDTHRYPQVLPGADAVLFMSSLDFNGDSRIDVLSFKTGKRNTLVPAGAHGRYLPSGHLVYLHRGTLFAAPMDLKLLKLTGPPVPVLEDVDYHATSGTAGFTFSRSGMVAYVATTPENQTQPLDIIDENGKVEMLPVAKGRYSHPRVSPDGTRLAVTVEQGFAANVWIYQWSSQRFSRFTFLNGNSDHPIWTPDGKLVLFSSDTTAPGPGIYCLRADGAGTPERLVEGAGLIPQSVSALTGRLMYEVPSGPNEGSWTAPVDWSDSSHPKPGVAERFPGGGTGVFSPDGKWVAYVSGQSGLPEVLVRPFPGGGQWQMSSGGEYPAWSHNGREVFYLSLPDFRITVTNFTVAGDSLSPAPPRRWNDLRVNSFDVLPNGKGIIAIPAADQKESTHATFVLNFMDDLRRRVPAAAR